MSFIRTKEINGNNYLYLVENHREDGQVKQEVIQYIGPAGSTAPEDIKEEYRDNLEQDQLDKLGTTEEEDKKSEEFSESEKKKWLAYAKGRWDNYDEEITMKDLEFKDGKVIFKPYASDMSDSKEIMNARVLKTGKTTKEKMNREKEITVNKVDESDKAIKIKWKKKPDTSGMSEEDKEGLKEMLGEDALKPTTEEVWLPKSETTKTDKGYFIPKWLWKKNFLPESHPEPYLERASEGA